MNLSEVSWRPWGKREKSPGTAAELSRWITYYQAPDGGHAQSWNVGPGLYERRLNAFLKSLRTSVGKGR